MQFLCARVLLCLSGQLHDDFRVKLGVPSRGQFGNLCGPVESRAAALFSSFVGCRATS